MRTTFLPNVKVPILGDALHIPMGSITRARARKLKEALNVFIQTIWAELVTFVEDFSSSNHNSMEGRQKKHNHSMVI
ncbi:hypothetical protein ES332_D03G088000v1 [Gossypium tomentosum]|uniref:Uncharacterized protein n=1 Tax=Gossypium tomentosum TaxID=34277 RepID=A0A5D2LKP8_GOSTO|nr:hypothetical protein ES332_D03G088000v1 [Gossypium tomentosum]